MSLAPLSARTAFCFVHASDLHLELPPHGLAEIPEHLRDGLLEAPYRAAERVFDLALSEKAAFLVLSGDVLAAESTGPRGPSFLVKQFQRLRERDIAVYWAAGQIDAQHAWPADIELPENVRRFGPTGAEIVHRRGGLAIAQLVGLPPVGSSAECTTTTLSRVASPGVPTIGVLHAATAPAPAWFWSVPDVRYWALGGSHANRTLLDDRCVAQFCGSPQGRTPEETGPHGCALVTVDAHGGLRQHLMTTDLFRWRRETVTIDESSTADQLREACRDRLSQLVAREVDVAHLICWTVQGTGSLARRLRREGFAHELLEELRSDYGYRNPAAWSVSLQHEHARAVPAEWYRHVDFLGDYLRAVRHHEQNAAAAVELSPYVGALAESASSAVGQVVERLRVVNGADRDRLLEQAAWLGVDLLQPQPGATPTITPMPN
jgi:hypothetical protein